MRVMEISGANRFDTFTRTRAGSRAVIVREGQILLSHETVSGWWLVPGGGMEDGETPEACCVREVQEETGLIVRPVERFLTLYEYYEEYRYISHYFICEVTGEGRMDLTDEEKRRGAVPEWLPLQEAVELFSKHQSYAAVSEEQRGSYLREYTALTAYLDHRRLSSSVIRPVEAGDRAFWFGLDRHLSEDGFARKVRDKMGYVLTADGEPVAVMRWSLFWDSIPFCDLLYVRDGDRKKGFGRKLMAHWEREMGRAGYGLVMTSTQADEEAQHFYRSLGYKDCGGLILPFPGYEQPLELIMAKTTGEGT